MISEWWAASKSKQTQKETLTLVKVDGGGARREMRNASSVQANQSGMLPELQIREKGYENMGSGKWKVERR